MKIDIGLPSEHSISGIEKRIQKMNKMQPIPQGLGLDFGTGKGAYYGELNNYIHKLYAFDKTVLFLKDFKKIICKVLIKYLQVHLSIVLQKAKYVMWYLQ